MFPEPTELLLIGYSIESIWTLKSKSSTLTPKTNSQTCWPRETSHVMNGIIFCVCLTLAISVPQIVLKWCRKERKKIQVKKESQQSRRRWWIWSRDASKGFLMCYLLLHQKARWKPDMKVNFLWARQLSRITEQGDLLKTLTHQAAQNGMLIKTWSQYWKSDELMEDRTRRPVVFAQHTPKQNQKCRLNPDHSCTGWMIKCERGSTNPQKMQQKTATTTLWYVECLCLRHWKHLSSWRRITQTMDIPSKNYRRSHFKTDVRHIWEVDSRNNQMRFMEWLQLAGKILHGSIYLWLVMNKSSVFSGQRSTSFQILYYALERWTRTHNQIYAWEDRLTWFKSSSEYRALYRIDGEPMELEWNIFPGFTTLQLCNKVREFLSNMSTEPENFTERIIFMSMFNDISWGSEDNAKECESSAQPVSLYAKRFSPGQWSFLGPGS